MKKLGCLVIMIIVGIIAWVTNPGDQAHLDNAYKVLKEQGVDNYGIDPAYITIGEGMLGKKGMDGLMKSFVKRKDYYLFSLTQVDIMGDKHYVALGLFGKMWNVF